MDKGNGELFATLLGLPLFQGISHREFTDLMGRMRITRRLYPPSTCIVNQDTPCNSIFFILEGQITSSFRNDNGHYTLTEWLNPPIVIQPEMLFGLRTHFSRTFTAVTTVRSLEIEKGAVRDVLLNYEIFRLNLLNYLCNRLQQNERNFWRPLPDETCGRLFRFLHLRCLHPAGKKLLTIHMKNLAGELKVTRLTISKTLNDLNRKRLIILRRGQILIPFFERLAPSSN